MATINLARTQGDYGFEATDENGHTVRMDSNPATGGLDFGVRPMQMLLMGLGGCSGIDVIGILKKQRQEVTDFKMVIKGERESGKEPSLWADLALEFHIYGNIAPDKAQKAVELSVDKYCSVAATLVGAGAKLQYTVFVHPAA